MKIHFPKLFNLAALGLMLSTGQLAYAQNYQWANGMGSSSAGVEDGNAVATDGVGNVFVGGEFRGTADFDPSANIANLTPAGTSAGFIAKYDPSGAYQWAYNFGDATLCRVINLTTDANGNVYAIGIFKGTADFDPGANVANLTAAGNNTYDIFVLKLSASGSYLWAFNIGGSLDDTGGGIALDPITEEVVISGYYQQTMDVDHGAGNMDLTSNGSYDAFVAKYQSADGSFVADRAWSWGGGNSDRSFGVAVDGNSNIIAVGRYNNTVDFDPTLPGGASVSTSAGSDDCFAVQFSFSGAYNWHVAFGSSGTSEECLGVAVDPMNDVYLVGRFLNSIDVDHSANVATLTSAGGFDGFLVKYNSAGAYQWGHNLGAAGSDNVQAVALDGYEVFICGEFNNTVDFDWGANTSNLTSTGAADAYIAKYSGTSGVYLNALAMGGSGAETAKKLTATNGTVYLAGNFSATADFNPDPMVNNDLTSVGASDVYVAKYGDCLLADMPNPVAMPSSVCAGTQASLSVNGAALGGATDWVWYADNCGGIPIGTGNTIMVVPSMTTTYYVRAEGGCVGQGACGSFMLTVNQNPTVITTGASASCNSPNGIATAVASGGMAPYSYMWNNGQFTATATGLAAGAYNVTVVDVNGCAAATSHSVGSISSPALTASITKTNMTCNGVPNGTATIAMTSGSAPYTYLWSNGQTTASATGLAQAIYYVTATDANGCTVKKSALVSSPAAITLSKSSTSASCAGNDGTATVSATGGTGTKTFVWSTGEVSATITGLTAGNYGVTATDINGCQKATTVTVSNSCVVNLTFQQTNPSCNGMCNGAASVLPTSGTAPYTYLWGTNAGSSTQSSVTGLCSGTYRVTVTDHLGAVATGAVTITQPALLSVILSKNNATCSGRCDGSANATPTGGTGPYSFVWSNGSTTAGTTGLCQGTHYVTITDANGCTLSKSFLILQNAINVTIATTPSSCNPSGSAIATVTGTGVAPYTYLWSNGATINALSSLAAGTYSVTVTDMNGCAKSASKAVANGCAMVVDGEITDGETANAMEGIEASQTWMSVYPNPNEGQFQVQIELANEQTATLRIQDMLGRTLQEQTLQGQYFLLPMDASTWANGAYIVQVITREGQQTMKVVIGR